MKYLICIILVTLLFFASALGQETHLEAVPFNQVSFKDGFWKSRLEAHAQHTLPVCIAQTRDSTERINNFKKAAGIMEGKHIGIYFDDSDVYKAMEGIAYSLINNPNPEYEALLDQWIDWIAKSQQPDGYLNTYFTLNHPEERWTDMEKHEMYCGGHMIEAAIAHYKATGKRTFLDVAIKFADHVDRNFGPGKKHWVMGHQELELALVKLHKLTDEERYLDLAHWLLEERGHGHGRGMIWDNPHYGPEYCQDDIPVSQITDIKGHAVRAMYMFSGMADVASEMDVPEYVEALEMVWEDVAHRNMYVTGGIGSSRSNEGFTEDYDLPDKTAYCETCASIGMVFWNSRMNRMTADSKYADIMERSLYNGVLSGISLEGDLFFYVNPLESDGDHHRQRWFGCACCPSNVSRFIPSVGNYIYTQNDDEIFVNLYMANQAEIGLKETAVKLIQKTQFPWDGTISIEVNPAETAEFELNLRIPGWCKAFNIMLNEKPITATLTEEGYLSVPNTWKPGDHMMLHLDMPVELVEADPRVKDKVGKRAIQRGPIVYCLEETDNKSLDFNKVSINNRTTFNILPGTGILNDMKILKAVSTDQVLSLIPYFSWDNREPGKMKVWVDYEEAGGLYRIK